MQGRGRVRQLPSAVTTRKKKKKKKKKKKTVIGQVEVRCNIPEPAVQGVVKEIPRYVAMDEFLKRIDWVSGGGRQTSSKVKGASRLTFKDETPSDATRVTFVEAASVDENQQAAVQRQDIRGRGTTLLQVPQIRAHKPGIQGQVGGLQNVWPPRPLNLRVQVSTDKMSELEGGGGALRRFHGLQSPKRMGIGKQAKGRKLHAQGPCLPIG